MVEKSKKKTTFLKHEIYMKFKCQCPKLKFIWTNTSHIHSFTLRHDTMAELSCCDTEKNDPENLKYLIFGPFRTKFADLWSTVSPQEAHYHPGFNNLVTTCDLWSSHLAVMPFHFSPGFPPHSVFSFFYLTLSLEYLEKFSSYLTMFSFT